MASKTEILLLLVAVMIASYSLTNGEANNIISTNTTTAPNGSNTTATNGNGNNTTATNGNGNNTTATNGNGNNTTATNGNKTTATNGNNTNSTNGNGNNTNTTNGNNTNSTNGNGNNTNSTNGNNTTATNGNNTTATNGNNGSANNGSAIGTTISTSMVIISIAYLFHLWGSHGCLDFWSTRSPLLWFSNSSSWSDHQLSQFANQLKPVTVHKFLAVSCQPIFMSDYWLFCLYLLIWTLSASSHTCMIAWYFFADISKQPSTCKTG